MSRLVAVNTQLSVTGTRTKYDIAIPDSVYTTGLYHDGVYFWTLNNDDPKFTLLQMKLEIGKTGSPVLELTKSYDITGLLAEFAGTGETLVDLYCLTGDNRMLYVAYSYQTSPGGGVVVLGARISQINPSNGAIGEHYDGVITPLYPPSDICYDGSYFYLYTKQNTPTTMLHQCWKFAAKGRGSPTLKQERSISSSNVNDIIWAFDYNGRHFTAFRTVRRGLEHRSAEGIARDSYSSTNLSMEGGCFERRAKYDFTKDQDFFCVIN